MKKILAGCIFVLVTAAVLTMLLSSENELVSQGDNGALDAYKINFTLQEIHDSQMNNELAATVAVPDGWKVKDPNIVQWTPMTYSDPARIFFTLNGPEDEVTYEFTSTLSFRYDYGVDRLGAMLRQQQAGLEQQVKGMMSLYGINAPMPQQQQQQIEYRENTIDGGGIVKKPVSPEEFVKSALSQDKTISGVQITKIEKPEQIVAALAKTLPELNKQITDTMRQSGVSSSFNEITADTALVEFTCFKDGKQYEQQIAVIMTYTRFGSPTNIVTGAADEMVYWTIAPIVSVYALNGKLKNHDLEIATIMGNSQVNPVWKAKVDYLVTETTRKVNERQLKSQQELQKTMNETFDYISKTRQEVFQNRQDSMSKVSQGWVDVITETDRVRGDDGKIYPVPTGTFPDRRVPWAW